MDDADYDNAWKDVLGSHFRAFLAYFLPEAAREIDWSIPSEQLDKELQQVAPDSEVGGRTADKLVKVFRTGGQEVWVAVHVEVQGQPQPGFAERMYVYNYRIYDRFRVNVCSVGVLTDDSPSWRPDRFEPRASASQS